MSGDLRQLHNKGGEAQLQYQVGCKTLPFRKAVISRCRYNIYTIGLLHYLMKSQEDYIVYAIT